MMKNIDHCGEPRMINEEMREFHGVYQSSASVRRRVDRSSLCGETFAPGRAIGMPSTMTRSGGRQAGADDPEAVAQIAELNLLWRDNVVRANGQHDAVRLVRQDGSIRHKQVRAPAGRTSTRTRAKAAGRQQQSVSVRWRGHGSCRLRDRARYRRSRACLRVLNWLSSSSAISTLSASGRPALLTFTQERHVICFAHVEVQVDRIDRDERCEQSGRAACLHGCLDKVADRDEMRPDPAREGRRDAA